MATKIRLRRMGGKKKPFYRVIVADSRSPRDGRFIEELGYYDPLRDPAAIEIDKDKVAKWMACGAQPTESVKSLLRRAGINISPGRGA
ncbi:MAG: 30S ribosomal protein S16 [Clostridia bacterium]|nr:30S ribosomal protein S16 [Clostridia bacterium]